MVQIHWARKSQQPLVMPWTIRRDKISAPILLCTTDKKKDILTIDRINSYIKYDNCQITDKVNSR